MSENVGYVVIEYNQASHQPSLATHAPFLFDSADDAEVQAAEMRKRTQEVGRRERFAVATVTVEEDS